MNIILLKHRVEGRGWAVEPDCPNSDPTSPTGRMNLAETVNLSGVSEVAGIYPRNHRVMVRTEWIKIHKTVKVRPGMERVRCQHEPGSLLPG